MRTIQLPRVLLWLFMLSLLVACATSPTGRKQLILVSENQAISASKTAYAQTIKTFADEGRVDNDPTLARRVQTITDRLIVQAIKLRPATKDWEWSIKVLDDPEMVNAWAMAGGKMAVFTGLIQKIQPTDDELAQVLGHEISHALANHTAERMSIAMASSLGVMAVGAAVENRKEIALTGAALAAKLAVELPNSRTSESEADRIGIELAAKAGYHPRAAVTLWQKMGRLSGGSKTPQFLSTHPAPKNRMKTLNGLIPEMMPYYRQATGNP